MKTQLSSETLRESSSVPKAGTSDFDLLDAYSHAVASTVQQAGPAVVHIQALSENKIAAGVDRDFSFRQTVFW